MKNAIFIILIFVFPFLVIAQIEIDESTAEKLKNSNDYIEEDFDEEEIEEFIKEKKLKLRMEVGTMFGTTFGSGQYFGTYVSPHLNYRLNPKLEINIGARINNYYGNIFYEPTNNGLYSYPSSNLVSSFVYVEGAYQLNDKLRLSGTVYKRFNIFNDNSPVNYGNDYDYEGIIMGVDYKIGENAFIHGEIEISNGRNPYQRYPYHDPFNRTPQNTFGSPF